jgi:hypothetical protein
MGKKKGAALLDLPDENEEAVAQPAVGADENGDGGAAQNNSKKPKAAKAKKGKKGGKFDAAFGSDSDEGTTATGFAALETEDDDGVPVKAKQVG